MTAQKEPQTEERSEDSEEEEKRPSEEYTCYGVDLKPFLPLTLALSTVIGGVCFFSLQLPLVGHWTPISHALLFYGCALVYGLTLACMMYATWADPGQVNAGKKTRGVAVGDIEQGGAPSMPLRAHQSFQYERPIRRYDHWCKYVNNVIGLLNHREFVIMLGGLSSIAVLGIVVDALLTVLIIARNGLMESTKTNIILALHFVYSVILLKLVLPIIRIHIGLISRNEMGIEWKNHRHNVANDTSRGDNIYVHELDDEEFNELLEGGAFVYDASRNPFDQGCLVNCWTFWCQARWTSDAKGEF